MAAELTELRIFMLSQECTLADSAALIMAEVREAFPTEGTRALAAARMPAASMAAVAFMAAVDATR
jgi:hypothetical protein